MKTKNALRLLAVLPFLALAACSSSEKKPESAAPEWSSTEQAPRTTVADAGTPAQDQVRLGASSAGRAH
ncbi:MAG: hypothetical protein EOP09_09890 [Proteobacteria bacterium]|nr:MAG: hypothetical protein EOP09_09890 [Pseudomonadota bacterium]